MIKIYVDGASKGNPGPGGSGVVAYDSKNNTILQSYQEVKNYSILQSLT